jgi:GPH family glycoside/pentoside/hexuronide:cation symporter
MKKWFKHPTDINEPLTGAEITGMTFAGTSLAVLQVVISVFIAYFYTDVVGINAAAVGTLLLITRIADGFTDLGMGVIISKTRSKWGQARPWVFRMAVPLLLMVVLTFFVPQNWDLTAKTVYACVTYFLMITVAITPAALIGSVIGTNMTVNPKSRQTSSVISTLFVVLGSVVGNIAVLQITQSMGDSYEAWRFVAVIFGSLAFIGQAVQFLLTKERISHNTDAERKAAKPSVKSLLPALVKNKYFIIMCFVGMMGSIDGAMMGSVIYYVKYVLGSMNLVNVYAVINLVFMMAGVSLTPFIVKKIPRKNLIMAGLALKILTYAINILFPANIWLFFAFSALRALTGGPMMVYGGIFLLNTIEYGEYKTGVRANHLIVSVSSVFGKIGSGLGGALIGWLLSLGRYDGALAVQEPLAQNMIVNIYFLIPLVAAAATFVLMAFYNLDKRYDGIAEELKMKK